MEFDDYEKVPDSQVVRGPDLLKMLPLDTKLFDNLSSSESDPSELSLPFSDPVFSVEVETKIKAKKLFGKDLYTGFSFSSEFKTVMEDIKKENILKNPDLLKTESMIAENVEECLKIEEKSHKVETPEPLHHQEFDSEVDKREEENVESDEKIKEKEGKDIKLTTEKAWHDDEETIFDTMSGYWRLLSGFDEFKISPPWYDAYAEGKEHWLQTKSIPNEVLERSREKCLNWLTKHFEK